MPALLQIPGFTRCQFQDFMLQENKYRPTAALNTPEFAKTTTLCINIYYFCQYRMNKEFTTFNRLFLHCVIDAWINSTCISVSCISVRKPFVLMASDWRWIMRGLTFVKSTESYLAKHQHTPPEWAYKQKSWPEKWYTTYCQGPLGLPKNAFGQIWELSF